ncbi:hypothetical protein BO78DRAFT_132379 [Aspergillus sclerotiicarbonarius CBS 121057]|uniref:Secreted protein n=1 Tax=Aspergillus sclerotiicarbonarius (strain CBS 121057 / IBT 28362) TaxID=1448318 RepID=A0A319EM66_ASPSB|nr:hypothetical protein BO78DRAFT_132379 [Aspergillus sclerotiicarbonarius CBS 121057]
MSRPCKVMVNLGLLLHCTWQACSALVDTCRRFARGPGGAPAWRGVEFHMPHLGGSASDTWNCWMYGAWVAISGVLYPSRL